MVVIFNELNILFIQVQLGQEIAGQEGLENNNPKSHEEESKKYT